MTTPRFRLTLDPPYKFAVEQGYYRASHCFDMRPTEKDLDNCVQDPLTKLITLAPSHLTPVYYNAENWVPLSGWAKNPDFWKEVYRGADPDKIGDPARFYTTLDPGTSAGMIPQLVAISYGIVTLASALASDTLVWVAQTSAALGADEGFVWNYHAIGDEHHRPENWFALAWGGILLHFSTAGVCRCYLYPRLGATIDYTATPELYDSFQFGNPGDVLNKEGAFSFQAIPRYGLAIYHISTPASQSASSSSASSQVTNGKLIKLPLYEDGQITGTGDVLLPSSPLALAVCSNLLRMHHLFGMHKISYPTTGTFIDALYDPGFDPSTLPETAPSPIFTKGYVAGVTTIASSVKKHDLSGDWSPGGDRQGRVVNILSTGDTRYTPYLLATNLGWYPLFETRNTTPVTLAHFGSDESLNLPDRIFLLEFTDTENGRFEGSADVMVKSTDARKIIERGDMTFAVDKSFDDGLTWVNHAGGLARVEGDVSAILDDAGMYYVAKLTMADMYARYREMSVLWENALDGKNIPDAINLVQSAASLSRLVSIPLELVLATIPAVKGGEHWRFAPRISDHGDEVIRNLLLLARRQNEEWLLKHTWSVDEWSLTRKPRDLSNSNLWTFTPFKDEVNLANRYVLSGDGSNIAFTFAPIPPEANKITPFGLTGTNPNESDKVPCPPITNFFSLLSSDSVDYLGRLVTAAPIFAALSNEQEISIMGRRVYDATCHRRLKAPIKTRDYIDNLKPLCRVNVRGKIRLTDGSNIRTNVFTEQWIKMRSVRIDYNAEGEIAPWVTYHTDSVWEGEIK